MLATNFSYTEMQQTHGEMFTALLVKYIVNSL